MKIISEKKKRAKKKLMEEIFSIFLHLIIQSQFFSHVLTLYISFSHF
jgi:hypothetical protein